MDAPDPPSRDELLDALIRARGLIIDAEFAGLATHNQALLREDIDALLDRDQWARYVASRSQDGRPTE